MTERSQTDVPRVARWIGLALVVGALATTGVEIADREPAPEVATVLPSTLPDPLSAELARCRGLVDPNAVDERCRVAWAESRRRFLAPHVPDETPVRVIPLPGKNREQLAPGVPEQPSVHDRTGR